MSSKYSDTIAREQQIREIIHQTKSVQTRSNESKPKEIIIIAILHIICAFFLLGHFTITNESLIREIYNILIDTSNETLNKIPVFLKTIR